jgi:hypothetical protein
MDNTVYMQTKVTKTAAFVGTAFDVSAITGDYTVFIRVIDLKGTVRLHFADSLDNFVADNLPGPCFSMKGTLTKDATVTKSFLRRDFPSLRFGTTSAKLRLDVAELTGDATKSVTYEAWIQYAS